MDTGIIVDHAFSKSGEYIVTLKVTDDKGEYRKKQIQIKVTSNWLAITLLSSTALLLLLLLGLLIPGSRFHHKKMFAKSKKPLRKKK